MSTQANELREKVKRILTMYSKNDYKVDDFTDNIMEIVQSYLLGKLEFWRDDSDDLNGKWHDFVEVRIHNEALTQVTKILEDLI